MTMIEPNIAHHFLPALYAKETLIPAGFRAVQHAHEHPHASVLVRGTVTVTVDGVSTYHAAPAYLIIEAGKTHEVVAQTDAVWYCIHATDETDATKIDEVLVCRG